MQNLCNNIWSEAIERTQFGIIADWFACRFTIFGLVAIIAAAIAGGLTSSHEAREAPPPVAASAPNAAQTQPTAPAPALPPTAAAATAATTTVAATPPSLLPKFDLGLFFRILGLGLLFAGACTICGWNLGLLFGIPRSLARSNGGTPSAGAGSAAGGGDATSQVNTNLEGISDWLTKTIVGVGLTSLTSAPAYIWDISKKINTLGFGWDKHGALLALAVMLYFGPGGFWMGYVGTRTILTKFFDQIDRSIRKDDVATAAGPDSLWVNGAGGLGRPASATIAKTDSVMLSKPLSSLGTPEEVTAWAAAKARAGDLGSAITALKDVWRQKPGDTSVATLLKSVYLVAGKIQEAKKLAWPPPPPPGTSDSIPPNTRLLDILMSLYDPPPGGYENAIKLANNLESKIPPERRTDVDIWLICAHAQKYRHLKDSKGGDENLQKARDEVMQRITTLTQSDPTIKSLLRSLWQPPEGAEDDDLACFPKDDPDLNRLLGG